MGISAILACVSVYFLMHGSTAASALAEQPATIAKSAGPQELVQGTRSHAEPNTMESLDSRVAVPVPTDRAGWFNAEIRLSSKSTGKAHSGRVLLVSNDPQTQRWVNALDGMWRGLLPEDTYSVAAVETADSVPIIECDSSLSALTPLLEIQLQPSSHWELMAVDKADGTELRDLTIQTHTDDEYGIAHVTRSDDVVPSEGVLLLAEGVPSPAMIEEQPSQGIYWVSAPGYLPKAVRRNRFQKRVRVELERYGELNIRVTAAFLDQAHALSTELGALTAYEGLAMLTVTPLLEGPAPQPTRITQGDLHHYKLVPGEYSVAAVIPAPALSPLNVFKRTIQVHPDDVTHVELDSAALDPIEEAEATALTLVAILPESVTQSDSWSAQVQVLPLGSTSWKPLLQEELSEWSRESSMNAFVSTFQHVPLGQYRFRLMPSGSSIEFELMVAQPHATEIVLDGSDLTPVDLELLGNSQDADALVAQVTYLEGNQVIGGQRTQLDPHSNTTRLWCPPTQLRMQVLGNEVASKIQDVFPLPGEATKVQMKLSDSNLSLLKVTAWDGDSHAYGDQQFWSEVSVEAVGHSGALLERRYGQLGTSVPYGNHLLAPDWSQCVFVLSSPGEYRLEVPWKDESLVIDVPPGISERDFFIR